jgi:hypothetical protein
MKNEAISIPTPQPAQSLHFPGGNLRLMAAAAVVGLALLAGAGRVLADQVEMQNGDRYAGTVLSVDSGTVVLRSDVLGKVSLPRGQVAVITFGLTPRSNAARLRGPATNELARALQWSGSKTNSELASLLRQLGGDTNSQRQVREQFLGQAGPEASQKFDQMMSDLGSGKMTFGDLRAQAKAALEQVRGQRGELNGELGGLLDSYTAILDDFLKQTAPAEGAVTNQPPR